jgi:hypothetical protein
MRLIKRFFNQFSFDIKGVADKVVFTDFFNVIVLKFFYNEAYTDFVHDFYRVNNYAEYLIKSDIAEYEISEKAGSDFKEIAGELIKHSQSRNTKSICFIPNHWHYFNFADDDELSLSYAISVFHVANFNIYKQKIQELIEYSRLLREDHTRERIFDDFSQSSLLLDDLEMSVKKYIYLIHIARSVSLTASLKITADILSKMKKLISSPQKKYEVKNLHEPIKDFLLSNQLDEGLYEGLSLEVLFPLNVLLSIKSNSDNSKYNILSVQGSVEVLNTYFQMYFERNAESELNFNLMVILYGLFLGKDLLPDEVLYKTCVDKTKTLLCKKPANISSREPDYILNFLIVLIPNYSPQTSQKYSFADYLLPVFESVTKLKDFLQTNIESPNAAIISKYVVDENFTNDFQSNLFEIGLDDLKILQPKSSYDIFFRTYELID